MVDLEYAVVLATLVLVVSKHIKVLFKQAIVALGTAMEGLLQPYYLLSCLL